MKQVIDVRREYTVELGHEAGRLVAPERYITGKFATLLLPIMAVSKSILMESSAPVRTPLERSSDE